MRWLLRYISTHTFTPFAWYRIAFGIVVLATAYSGVVELDGAERRRVALALEDEVPDAVAAFEAALLELRQGPACRALGKAGAVLTSDGSADSTSSICSA